MYIRCNVSISTVHFSGVKLHVGFTQQWVFAVRGGNAILLCRLWYGSDLALQGQVVLAACCLGTDCGWCGLMWSWLMWPDVIVAGWLADRCFRYLITKPSKKLWSLWTSCAQVWLLTSPAKTMNFLLKDRQLNRPHPTTYSRVEM